jgi:hypothetical protein
MESFQNEFFPLIRPFESNLIKVNHCGVGRGTGVGRDLGMRHGRRRGCVSNAPISMRPLNTRSKGQPRWSLKGGGLKFGSPASIAGLPGNKACVNVGPTVVLQRTDQRSGVNLIAGDPSDYRRHHHCLCCNRGTLLCRQCWRLHYRPVSYFQSPFRLWRCRRCHCR